jgi:hypothetical protein
MRLAKLRLQFVLRQSGLDPRDKIVAIGFVVGVLELAAAALREVPARRILVVRARREGTIVHEGVAGNAERHMAAG